MDFIIQCKKSKHVGKFLLEPTIPRISFVDPTTNKTTYIQLTYTPEEIQQPTWAMAVHTATIQPGTMQAFLVEPKNPSALIRSTQFFLKPAQQLIRKKLQGQEVIDTFTFATADDEQYPLARFMIENHNRYPITVEKGEIVACMESAPKHFPGAVKEQTIHRAMKIENRSKNELRPAENPDVLRRINAMSLGKSPTLVAEKWAHSTCQYCTVKSEENNC